MQVSQHTDRRRPLRAILLIGLGAILVWQIVTRSLAAHLALEAPGAALSLHPSEAMALVNLADAKLNPRNRTPESGAAASFTQQVLDAKAQPSERGDRFAGWAEIALKAFTAKQPPEQSPGEAAAPSLTPEDRAQIRAQAESALRNDPLNARALRILGQLAVAAGDEPRAAKLMHAAADRSLSESVAVYWMLQRSFATKDHAKTVFYADTFLRKRPQLIKHVVPMLARLAESGDKDAAAALSDVLASDPPWRHAFFARLPQGVADARTPLNLLLGVKATDKPPTTQELETYLRFLIGKKLYELAYYTWLQFLPAEELGKIGYIANSSFESTPSGLPFDWVIAQGTGATIDIAALPGEPVGHGLLLELGPGRADFRGVSQLLLLTPGSYRLEGKFKGETRGARGLQWSVRCAGSGKAALGEGPMFVGVEPKWSDFDFAFTVPDADCRAQELRLVLAARSASEQLVSGAVWYDELRIARLPEPDPGP
jgi:hypothetical protein